MSRIDELEERIEYVENTKKSEIAEVFDRVYQMNVYASGYVTDIEIDVISTAKASIILEVNGTKNTFSGNFVITSFKSERVNSLLITVVGGGEVLSSRLRIKGIGVKLLK